MTSARLLILDYVYDNARARVKNVRGTVVTFHNTGWDGETADFRKQTFATAVDRVKLDRYRLRATTKDEKVSKIRLSMCFQKLIVEIKTKRTSRKSIRNIRLILYSTRYYTLACYFQLLCGYVLTDYCVLNIFVNSALPKTNFSMGLHILGSCINPAKENKPNNNK